MTNPVILIFVRKAKTLDFLLTKFRELPYNKIIRIQNLDDRIYRIQRLFSSHRWLNKESLFILLTLLIAMSAYHQLWLASALLIALLVFFNLLFMPLERLMKKRDHLVLRYKKLVMAGETLLLVECHPSEFEKFIKVIQKVQDEPLAFFSTIEQAGNQVRFTSDLLPHPPETVEELTRQANVLASSTFKVAYQKHQSRQFLSYVQDLNEHYQESYRQLSNLASYNENIQLSAEWLLDNAYTVKQSLSDIKRNLPEKYFSELPFITQGAYQGSPMLYPLVSKIVAASDGKTTAENITLFLNAYQKITPLTMGDLWAFPLILKIRLIECLVYLTSRIIERVNENQLADFWANRILYASRINPEKLYNVLSLLSEEIPSPSTYFADQLMIQLTDTEAANAVLFGWLQRKLGDNLHDIIQAEQGKQTLEQTSIANVISSLRRLEQMNWREVFLDTSLTEKILSKDPAHIYSEMDFPTKDRYRHAVEKIAKKSKTAEQDVAAAAISLSEASESQSLQRHVGYFLIDKGEADLAKKVAMQKPSSIKAFLEKFSEGIYLAACLVTTLLTAGIFLLFINLQGMSWPLLSLLTLVSLIPFSELAIQLLNYLLSHAIPPHILPKMSYESGVPERYRTLVVVPTLLTSEKAIRHELEKIEIHFLANTDPQIAFGILSDFADSSSEANPEDAKLLQIAKEGILFLNKKYSGSFFYLFHRDRKMNSAEKCWMGWERKRGKIENLNSFLGGAFNEALDSFLHEGDPQYLAGICYVLTADSDTQLPKGSVKRLIETLSHPLNEGRFDPATRRLLRGYTIIQPRVSTNYLSATSTWFAKLFSDPSGIDPYTKSTSDVYQDVFHEGVYHGKGLYNYQLFHQILSDRLPQNQILSHDLLEGAYVRVAFASDIEFYDSFPETYAVYAKRQHRWVRGDWQLLGWLRSTVPAANNTREPNPLSPINRWKIFDNLRRSLFPITSLATLILSWSTPFFLPWTCLILLIIALPILLRIIDASWITAITKLNSSWNEICKGVIKTLVTFAFLPHQALINADAILKALYRQFWSHRHLLQWSVSSVFTQQDQRICYIQMGWVSALSLFFGLFLIFFLNTGLVLELPILALWMLSPLVCILLNRPYLRSDVSALSPLSIQYLRLFARKTWRYFDDFVTEEAHYLPPDNYQEKLKVEVAYRTSPTNIGLYLMSAISACRFGHIMLPHLIQRLLQTTQTLKSLERYEGHFLNWYDIKNISPLLPKYVSTVDSGNLLASIWALESKLHTMEKEPILDPLIISQSIQDHIQLIFEALHQEGRKATPEFRNLYLLGKSIRKIPHELQEDIWLITSEVQLRLESVKLAPHFPQEAIYWLKKLHDLLIGISDWMQLTMPWISLLQKSPAKKIAQLHPEGVDWKRIASERIPTFHDILKRNIEGVIPIIGWLQTIPEDKLDDESSLWIKNFLNEIPRSFQAIEGLKSQADGLLQELQSISSEMNLAFLYNQERKLFSIGYNVSNHCLDSSCYDLLASEARLASFIAIAKDDVPLEHWWALGRPTTEAFGMIVLQSWGGTMFEYLMPVIWCKNFSNTLLDYACKAAVECQIAYGKQLGIPWGISESAYSRLDIHNIYQYRAFGVPLLGLKQGLENDFVVTPYSSALALMINPLAAIKNLKRLRNKEIMSGPYGFFEAIDYSMEYQQHGHPGIVIHTYMAHHLGMSLCACCNALFDGYIQTIFHSHPRVKALESILYERPDISDSKATGRTKEQAFPKLSTTTSPAGTTHFDSPLTPIPVTHLLSNGNYSIMITNSGSGYSKFQNIDISRWRVDPTCDNWGNCLYIKDTERNAYFSSSSFPAGNSSSAAYSVNFSNHKVEISKRDLALEVSTEIAVSPEDNVEIRYVTLSNIAMRYRLLEITSYVEIALAEHKADLIHPAFSKMFIETEAVEQYGALLAQRRKRSPEDPERWCFHLISMSTPSSQPFSYETRRDLFIGNTRSLAKPEKLSYPLSNSSGYVLDPIFSIRKSIRMEAGKRVKIALITGYANSREEAIRLIEKYQNINASQRVLDMAWTHAELDLRRLHITHDDAHLFQRLANFMIYPDIQLRASSDTLKANRFGQNKLWAHGISGDNPILLVTIEDIYNLDVVHSALLAHAFWRFRGLKADVVILNKEKTSYEQPLNEHLLRLTQTYAQYSGLNINGGIFLFDADKLPREDVTLLYTVAHAVLIAERGTLSQQLAMPRKTIALQSLLKTDNRIPEEPSPPLPFLQLLYFNGIGGFTTDGKEYAIFYEKGRMNSAPWINVIANKHFGFLASATGLGMTWNSNSQANRLTPWSNDSTLNPISDICYIRDDESGKFWTISASPILENDPYRARHGNGYTVYEHNSHAIEQEMKVFVPLDEAHTPVRIQILKLTNRSSSKRKLSIFPYAELTLAQEREESQRYIETSWNHEASALMAVNHYSSQFADQVAFMGCSPQPNSYTGSRKDFIGRNQNVTTPDALKRTRLSQRVGVAMDPCFALQTTIELYSQETKEIVMILGECPHLAKAKEICNHYKDINNAHYAFNHAKTWWDQFLSKIEIKTPDSSLDLLFNRWLTYQNLSCRMWGRSAFYQSGGAYGFRDQLQDAAALVYFDPNLTREHILKCASRQFPEGDVQHWWHVETGSGVRTKISDDLLWLPYVVMHYIQTTGDDSIMDVQVPYLEGRLLNADEHEIIVIPSTSSQQGSIKEHCLKAIEKSLALGPHSLPLIGGGDWNDGMNLVGIKGQGESVWLAWFLIFILKEMGQWLASKEDQATANMLLRHADNLLNAIEEQAWDGAWYLRAFFDDGTPVGSHKNHEDKIDSLSQSWAVINGLDTDRVHSAMKSVEEYLIDEVHRLILLFTPPFDKAEESPGYIKGYPPGVRENGGQYTHAAVWVAMAFAKRGEGDKAMHLLQMINPINRTKTPEELDLYRVEPYVTAADIYALPGQEGRGGWTWYTGSASLMYRTILEDIMGFHLHGNYLVLDPVIPTSWDGFSMVYWHGEACYDIHVENPQHVSKGVVSVELNQTQCPDKKIPLDRSPGKHTIKVTLGEKNV